MPVCLMIEDSKTQALHLSKQMSEAGWMAIMCFSVKDAKRLHSAQKPDSVLLDLYLADGESISAIPEIRSTWSEAPITLMTAGSGGEDVLRCLQRARKAGADFVIKKPFSQDDLRDILTDCQAISQTGQRRLHVLIVDDSKFVLKVASQHLRGGNFRVSVADTMEAALDRLTYDTVDVVVSDIFMPGMGGIEGIQRIGMSFSNLGIVAMSGGMDKSMSQDNALKAAQKIGADRCIPKPFNAEQIRRAVLEAVAIRGDMSRIATAA